jgi:uncharacterized protein (DUF4415 family)
MRRPGDSAKVNRPRVGWPLPLARKDRPVTERKRTKTEERAYAELHDTLLDLQEVRYEMKLHFEHMKLENMPWSWGDVEDLPVRKRKLRITAAFDADVVKFFRVMGNGYQARMNMVLRCYMLGIISRHIDSKKNRDWMGREI